MDKLDIILEQLQEIKSGMKELEVGQKDLKTGQKKLQKDITDIRRYLKIGIEEDIERLKSRVTELKKRK